MVLINSLDLGRGPFFKKSRLKLQVISDTASAQARIEHDIDFTSAFGAVGAWNEIVETESLLHLAGHGQSQGFIGGQYFRQLSVEKFADFVEYSESEITLDGLIVDACSTFFPDWFKQVRASIPRGHKLIYIGTKDDVDFGNAEIYMQVFFNFLLSKKYPVSRKARRELIKQAHKVASAAEEWKFGESFFRMKEITGS